MLARIEARRLRIALLLALVLHLLPVLPALSWPGFLARASDATTLIEIESTTQSAQPGGASAAERAAAEQAAAEQAAAEARAAAGRAAAARAAAERAERERAARELAEQIRRNIVTEPGSELTPRPPTAGPVERNVSGDPSLARQGAPGEAGEGPPAGDGPGTLTAKFCEISPYVRRIAEIQECASGPERYFEYLNVPPRTFEQGYPGFEETGRIEFFALFIHGNFDVSKPGRHHFRLTSDDGAQLFIDDQLVVDNDGLHSAITRHGSAELSAGRHRLRIVFFQSIRYELALQLFVTAPGEQERLFSSRL